MVELARSVLNRADAISPLVLSDRLITLAEAADGAGYTAAAEKLVSLAHAVLDEKPHLTH
jgi:hypothetical protein